MDDPVSGLERQIAELAGALRSVEARVAALEGAAAPALTHPPSTPDPIARAAGAPSAATDPSIPSIVALAGRCLFVLAGAFLIRALTDSGAFPRGAGVALGLAYALTWLVLADRAARAGSATAATAWGVTALVIACPLVWEASTHFDVLRPTAAAAVLLAVAAAAVGASVHRNLPALAWAAVLAVIPTACLLAVTTHELVTYGTLLVVLAAGAWCASTRRGWPGLPWLPAVAADLVVLAAAWIAARSEGLPEAYASLSRGAVLALALGLFGASLAGTIARWSKDSKTRDLFEPIQLGAGLLLVVFAVSRLTPLAALSPALVWGVLGFLAAVAPARAVSSIAPAYGAVLLAVAAADSGLAGFVRHAFLGLPAGGVPPAEGLVILGLSAAATALLAGRVRAGREGPAVRGAMFALACLSIAGAGALAVSGLAHLVAPDGETGRVAAARGAVLAATSVLLASSRRLPVLSSLAHLAYPVLAAAGVKLLFEDLPHGRPSTLVATFVLYGAALLIVPRLLRSARPQAADGFAP